MSTIDSILFMTLGLLFMLSGFLDVIFQTIDSPFMTITISIVGLVTFWLPMIMNSLED